jgi:apolipoprotein N-acyltransferase
MSPSETTDPSDRAGAPQRESLPRTVSFTLLRAVLSAVFLTAAWTKLRDPNGTLIAVYQYQILSWEDSEWFAIGLPWVEGVAGLGLWWRRTRLGANALICAMLAVFMLALGAAFVRKLDIRCGCFGSRESKKNAVSRLVEDALLLGICLPLLRRDARMR